MTLARREKPASRLNLAIAAIAAGVSVIAPALAEAPPDFAALKAQALELRTAPLSARANDDMRAIPTGTYTLGRADGPADQAPAHAVRLEAFRIDRTEVTNGAFAEYLNALQLPLRGSFGIAGIGPENGDQKTLDLLREESDGGDPYPIIALDDDQSRIVFAGGRFSAAEGYADHPVAETTWAGARAYCQWRTADLPSEAQWEAAARGPDDRLYPWGDEAPSAATAFVSGQSGVTGAVGGRPRGASPFGVLDMSGSMAEWTRSLKRPYPYDAQDGREAVDRAGERVTRGGDYVFDARPETLTVSHRNGFSNAPARGHRHIGFRCAR